MTGVFVVHMPGLYLALCVKHFSHTWSRLISEFRSSFLRFQPLYLLCFSLSLQWLFLIFFWFLSTDKEDEDPSRSIPRAPPQGKVNPYSVIDITPLQLQQPDPHHGPPSPASSPVEPKGREVVVQDNDPHPVGGTSSGYSVPVPCGYQTPSGVPLITPAYTTPVIIRHLSMDEDGKVESEIIKHISIFCFHYFTWPKKIQIQTTTFELSHGSIFLSFLFQFPVFAFE